MAELVDTIEACKEQLRIRRGQLAAETEAIEKALDIATAPSRTGT